MLWHWVIHLFTAGSQAYRDLPYAVASIDAMTILIMLALYFVLLLVMVLFLLKFVTGFSTQEYKAFLPLGFIQFILWVKGPVIGIRGRVLRRLVKYFFVFLILQIFFLLIDTATTASLIQTAFNTNRDIIAPYISEQERLEIQSQFRLMKSKNDYDKVMAKIEVVASEHKISLKGYPGD